MDSKTLLSRLSMESGKSTDEIASVVNAVASAIAAYAGNLDSVAVPGFGTFTAVHRPDSVRVDSEGRRMLTPPSISVEFKSSVVLRKSLS